MVDTVLCPDRLDRERRAAEEIRRCYIQEQIQTRLSDLPPKFAKVMRIHSTLNCCHTPCPPPVGLLIVRVEEIVAKKAIRNRLAYVERLRHLLLEIHSGN
jgi:hypothetical protein|uniref:Uncharacterized protein n=1 Tax=Zea mays TaxID=4577 RepID=C0HI09_MAIZE|nr:unknown [Zea mays]